MRLGSAVVLGLVFTSSLMLTGHVQCAPAKQRSSKSVVAEDPNVTTLRAILHKPDAEIDLAEVQVTIDHMIDPSIDELGTLKELDQWVATTRKLFPPVASNENKMAILMDVIYKAGPWNQFHPFSYDLNDPFGQNIQNKVLSHYLVSRKGNCVSMPTLVVILGQKLGLNVTFAFAPEHEFVQYRRDSGQWLNIEATSNGTLSNARYQSEYHITDLGMRSGIYLRPLTRKESVVAMMDTLMQFYSKNRPPADEIPLATLGTEFAPLDVYAMLARGSSDYRAIVDRYAKLYPNPLDIPASMQPDFQALSADNAAMFAKADSLGWRPFTDEENAAYVERIQSLKTKATK